MEKPLDILRRVMVLMPSHSGPEPATRRCVDAVRELGAGWLELAGCSDVALARNLVMTEGLESDQRFTVFALVDDDMVFTPHQLAALAREANASDRPVSAIYATSSAALAHTQRPDKRWNSGLGFMALRRDHLQRLADSLGKVEGINHKRLYPFCQCRPHGGEWYSEDYWFCHQFGGVSMLGFSVGHLKKMPIEADEETIALVLQRGKS